MTTIKSYTDLPQSKKLAEILHLESADMFYHYNVGIKNYYEDVPRVIQVNNHFAFFHQDVPCWSLAALLNILPKQVILSGSAEDSYWYCKCEDAFNSLFADSDNPVDTCVEMIIRLNKLNLL